LRLIILCSIPTFVFFYSIHKEKEIRKNGVWVEGRITKVGYKNIKYQYFVNGKYYEGLTSRTKCNICQKHEVFKVYYDKNNPSNKVISFYDYCIDTLDYEITYSNPIGKEFHIGKDIIYYSFQLDDENIERWHYINLQKKYSKGDRLKIYYNKKNPQISYASN